MNQKGQIKARKLAGLRKQTSSSLGMGLIEVLMVGLIGSVITAGSIKTLEFSIQAMQVARLPLIEQTLKQDLAKALSGGHDGACGTNLKPSSYPNGTLTGSHALKGLGTVPSLKIQNTEVLKTGADFKQQFHIIKMEMTGDSSKDPALTSEQPVSRNFVIYYKKNNLGNLSTKGGEECSADNTEGCYWASCSLHYALDSTAQKVSQCELLDCLEDTPLLNVLGKSCEEGSYLKGFDEEGNKECLPFPDCESGKVLRGLDSDGQAICTSLNCPFKQVLRGIEQDGTPDCVAPVKLDPSRNPPCSGGKFLTGINQWGYNVCKCFRRYHHRSGSSCDCSSNRPVWIPSTRQCGTCPSGISWHAGRKRCNCNADGKVWNSFHNECRNPECNNPTRPAYNEYRRLCEACPTGANWNSTVKRCECPSHRPYWSVSINYCLRCPSSRPIYNSSNNRCLACPSNRPAYNRSNQQCETCPTGVSWNSARKRCDCPFHTPKWNNNNQCEACPTNRPKYYSSTNQCEACWTGQPKYNSSTNQCEACTGGQFWDSSIRACRCLVGSHWTGSTCVTCRGGQVWQSTTKTCECPSGSHWNGSSCVTCRGDQVWQSATKTCECREGWHNSNGKCCPGGQYNDRGICCHTTEQNSGGHCCPMNAHWSSKRNGCRCNSGFYWNGSRCARRSSGSSSGGGDGGGDGRESDPTGSSSSSSGGGTGGNPHR